MRDFVHKTGLPFLATPMAKGVLSDSDLNSANSARSHVLKEADVILLCGARLNWILHFGLPPRFRNDVAIIQIDSDPLEINTNVKASLPINGDLTTIIS
jgi:2-hydroxyacyl-CoA lyase 1